MRRTFLQLFPSRPLFPLLSSCVFLVPTLSLAQEQNVSQQNKTEAPQGQTVEVKANYDSRRDDTAAKFIVRREDILKYGDQSLVDVLSRQPGVSSDGKSVSLNGFGAAYTLILIDGLPPVTGRGLGDIDPHEVERIEIIRSAIAEMSTQAIGGVINIVLKRRVLNDASQLKYRLAKNQPSSAVHTVNWDWQKKSDSYSYLQSLIIRDADFLLHSAASALNLDGDNRVLDRVDTSGKVHVAASTVSFTPRFDFKSENGDQWSAQFVFEQRHGKIFGPEYWSVVSGTPIVVPRVDQKNNYDVRIEQSRLEWKRELAKGYLLETQFSGSNFMRRDSVEQIGWPINALTPLRQRSNGLDTRHTWVSSGSLTNDNIASHLLKLGWEFNRGVNRSDKNYDDKEWFASRLRTGSLAWYAQDEWKLTPTWSQYLGLRSEVFQSEVIQSDGVNGSHVSRVTSPIAQSLWKLDTENRDQLRFAYARTFKNPDPRSITASLAPQINNNTAWYQQVGNPKLTPELAHGLDLAFEHSGEQQLSFALNVNLRMISDLHSQQLFNKDQLWMMHEVNDGRAFKRTVGVELGFPATLISDKLKQLQFKSSAQQTQSHFNSFAADPSLAWTCRAFALKLSLDYSGVEHVKMGLSDQFQSASNCRVSPLQWSKTDASHQIDSYLYWNMQQLSVRLAVKNWLAKNSPSESRIKTQTGYALSRMNFPNYRHISLEFNWAM